MKKKLFIIIPIVVVIILIAISLIIYLNNVNSQKPEDVLKQYFSLIEQEKYEEMYNLVNLPEDYSKDDFLARNKNIYQGIEANNIQIEIQTVEKEKNNATISYTTKMNMRGGQIEFNNTASLTKNENKQYIINWSSNLIFPELNNNYKVRVSSTDSKRGSLLDRNCTPIAKQGTISRVGIVPGKLGENKEENIKKIAQLLNISTDTINSFLSSSWVEDDSFVPIKNIPYDSEELKEQLLQISGIMIDSKTDRVYPYKEATSHITGYISSITAEELENMQSKGYTSSSVIGKTGLEKEYEDRLKGTDGVKIYIEDENGTNIKTIKEIAAQDGEDIKLTIDLDIQLKIYEQLKEDEGFFVVMNPKTGEILALVSTPSYDANKFILGMTNQEWDSLLNAEGNPLYTRFLESWCPGSTMKPLTGAIGLTSGTLTAEDEFNYSGLAWQKDSSWQDHKITTLTAYNGKKNLRNALIYSDNIYFAQAALQIGEKTFTEGLDKIKFNESIDFVLPTSKSQYSNTETIQSEATLADSGYGQGQILVNPIHMASIYSAFANDGNMIKPYIEYKENKTVEYLVENAFSKQAANEIKEGLIQVVENPLGTGHDVKVEGVTIAGKTGTAELKASKEDEGDILGWFDCFTTDQPTEDSLLIISMAKNQKSSYLKKIIKTLF